MFAPLSDQTRLDDVHVSSLSGSRTTTTQGTFQSHFRIEFAHEWGPCVVGIDQAMRGPLSAIGPAVFCGTITPCMHEMALDSHGVGGGCFASSLSGEDQERIQQMVESDSYIAWVLRVIPSEAADGARCSMGVLEHTTAASIIKEAIAAGVDVRGIRVSACCDPTRFRQFLFEAFPMIDDITVYPRIAAISCNNGSSSGCQPFFPSTPQSLPSSPMSPMGASASAVPSVVCAAGVVAQTARDTLSRQLLYRQRQFPSPLSKSPLSKALNPSRTRSRLTSSASGAIFNSPMPRSRSCSEENTHSLNTVRCAAFAGSEFGESHCGLVPEPTQSQSIPIEMFDFYDDESSIGGLTSPKRIRVVPCSPPLSTVISSEDSLPCVSNGNPAAVMATHPNQGKNVDTFEPCPFSSTSLFVSPPPFATPCSATSTSVPMYRPMFGLTSPF